MKRVSVVIPVRDRKDYLDYCLSSFLSQTYPQRNYEIIIVDDGSKDQHLTNQLRHRWALPLKVIRNERSLGPGLARHEGVKAASGEIILFTDGDMILPKHFLATHAAYHQDREDLVVTSPYRQNIYTKIYPEDLQKPLVKKMLEAEPQLKQRIPVHFAQQKQPITLFSREDVARGKIEHLAARISKKKNFRFMQKYGPTLKGCPVPWITFITYSASLTKKSYEQVGGFDPEVRFRHDDRALGYKLHTQGLTFICDPALVPIHQEHPIHQDMDTWLVSEYRKWLSKYPRREITLFGLRLLDNRFKDPLIYSQLVTELNELQGKNKPLAQRYERWARNCVQSLFSKRRPLKAQENEQLLRRQLRLYMEKNATFKQSMIYQSFYALTSKNKA